MSAPITHAALKQAIKTIFLIAYAGARNAPPAPLLKKVIAAFRTSAHAKVIYGTLKRHQNTVEHISQKLAVVLRPWQKTCMSAFGADQKPQESLPGIADNNMRMLIQTVVQNGSIVIAEAETVVPQLGAALPERTTIYKIEVYEDLTWQITPLEN